MVSVLAVNRTAHRIANQTGVKRGRLKPRVEFVAGIKNGFGIAVSNEFHADEKPSSSNVPYERISAERIVQHIRQLLPFA